MLKFSLKMQYRNPIAIFRPILPAITFTNSQQPAKIYVQINENNFGSRSSQKYQ